MTCFYPARGLTPKLSDDQVESLEMEIQQELEAAIMNERAAHELPTKLASRELRTLLLRLLVTRHNVRARPGGGDDWPTRPAARSD